MEDIKKERKKSWYEVLKYTCSNCPYGLNKNIEDIPGMNKAWSKLEWDGIKTLQVIFIWASCLTTKWSDGIGLYWYTGLFGRINIWAQEYSRCSDIMMAIKVIFHIFCVNHQCDVTEYYYIA